MTPEEVLGIIAPPFKSILWIFIVFIILCVILLLLFKWKKVNKGEQFEDGTA